MSYNFVVVSIFAIDQDGSPTLPQGTLHFQISDFVWDTSIASLVVVPPIDLEGDGGYTGNGMQIPLLAMDNANLGTNWSWLMSAELPGVANIPTRKLTVNFANGPAQNLTDLLATSTIVS